MEIGVGIIGFGLAGRAFHAPVIRAVPGLRLVAILQRHGDSAAERYPDVCIARSLEELLAIPEIGIVVIATPNGSHYSLARACMAAGRDVVVDKPFTTTFEEAKELVEFARRSGRLLTVYQNRRYDGDFEAVRQLVASGELGRVVRFEANYDRYRPELKAGAWREQPGPANGIFFDLGPHLIDYALVLFGLPEAVTADIRIERQSAVVDDAFDLTFHYAGGLRANLRSSILAVVPRPRFILHGTLGAFTKQVFNPQETDLRRGYMPPDGVWGQEPEEKWGVLTLADGENRMERRIPSAACDFRDFYANVRDAILGRGSLAVTPQWALDVMRLIELCQESSAKHRTIFW